MVVEQYLEYLALNSILQNYMDAGCLNTFKNHTYQHGWYADDTPFIIDLTELKKKVGELQREFLEPYTIDSNSES